MQVLDSNFVECWKQQYWAPLSWGSMEFSTFLVFAVWTASMTDLTFLVKVSCKMRIIFYPYIHASARVILFPITLYLYFADSQQLMHWAMKKLKTWTQQTWPLKEGTSLLKTCFVNIEWYFKERCYYDGPYRKFAVVTKKLRTATMKNWFIQNHFNPNAQLIFTWKGNQFYHKHFIVV